MALNFEYCKEKLEDVYDVKEELGRGQFAVVKRCLSKDTQEAVAAKFVKMKRSKSSRNGLDRTLIEREAGILNFLNHEKVLKLFNVFDLGVEMCLVLELLSGGELFDKISEQEYLTEVEAACYMKQVLQGVEYLHQNDIVHLDIKPENIVLKEKYGTDIKLVDFGLAQIVKPGDEIREMMGTPEFVAPEVINYDCIGMYTDMWAIGVLAYILLSGCSPFLGDDNQETYDNICRVDYHFDEEYFDTISEDAKLFVQELLIKNPKKRNGAEDCLDHPWVRSMAQFRSREDSSIIQTKRFKAFVARRRWQQSFQKMKAITRFSKFLKIRASAVITEEETDIITTTTNSNSQKPSLTSSDKHNYKELEDEVFTNPRGEIASQKEYFTTQKSKITSAEVRETTRQLSIIEDRRKSRRQIKPYLQFDDDDDDDGLSEEGTLSDSSYYSYSSEECSNEECSSEECSSEEEDETSIVDHATGELNRGTLEIWKLNFESLHGKRIRKIKKYGREKRIVYDELFMKNLENKRAENIHGTSSGELLTEVSIRGTSPDTETNITEISESAEQTSEEIASVNFDSMMVHQEKQGTAIEYEEVFDTIIRTKVETIEESEGPYETVYMNEVRINSICEDVFEIDEVESPSANRTPRNRQQNNQISPGIYELTNQNGLLANTVSSLVNLKPTANRKLVFDTEHFQVANQNQYHKNNNNNTTKDETKSYTKILNDVISRQIESELIDWEEYVIIDFEETNIKCRDRDSTSKKEADVKTTEPTDVDQKSEVKEEDENEPAKENTNILTLNQKQPDKNEEEIVEEEDPIVDHYFKKNPSSDGAEDDEIVSFKEGHDDDDDDDDGLEGEGGKCVQESDKNTEKLKTAKTEQNEDIDSIEKSKIPQSRNSSIHHLDVPGIVVSYDNSRRDSNASPKTSPNMRRKYSREMPVHYTELLRQMTMEKVVSQDDEGEKFSKEERSLNDESTMKDSENESSIETKTSNGHGRAKQNSSGDKNENTDENKDDHTTNEEVQKSIEKQIDEDGNIVKNDEAVTEENTPEDKEQTEEEGNTERADIFTIDLSTIKAFDIRDKKTCRISITGRHMLFEHRVKKTRSVSLDESRRDLDAGQRSQSLAGDSFSVECNSGSGDGLHQDDVFKDGAVEAGNEFVGEGSIPVWMKEQKFKEDFQHNQQQQQNQKEIPNEQKISDQRNDSTENNNLIVGDEFMRIKGWKSSNNGSSEKLKEEELTLQTDLKVTSHSDANLTPEQNIQNGTPSQHHGNNNNTKEKVSLPDIIPEPKIDKTDGKDVNLDSKNSEKTLDENENIPEQQKKTMEKQNLLIEEKMGKRRKGCGRCSIM